MCWQNRKHSAAVRFSILISCQQCSSLPPQLSPGEKPVEKRVACWMEALSLGAFRTKKEEWKILRRLAETLAFRIK